MHETHMAGLDGGNPLGFLAALGLMEVVDTVDPDSTLHWQEGIGDGGTAVLRSRLDLDALIDVILADAASWRGDPVIETWDSVLGVSQEMWLELERKAGQDGSTRSVRMLWALATPYALSQSGDCKSTPLCMLSGQEKLLKIARELRDGVTEDDLSEALIGPWTYPGHLPSLSLDPTQRRSYAYQATAPSATPRRSQPGADWLAFLGLPMLPMGGVAGKMSTRCWVGPWHSGQFVWPIWSAPVSRNGIESMLAPRLTHGWTAENLRAMSIDYILCSRVTREKGGRGRMSPSTLWATPTGSDAR